MLFSPDGEKPGTLKVQLCNQICALNSLGAFWNCWNSMFWRSQRSSHKASEFFKVVWN